AAGLSVWLSACFALLLGDGLVQVEDDAGHGCPGGELAAVELGVGSGFSDAEQILRGLTVAAVLRRLALRQVAQNLPLFGSGPASGGEAESEIDSGGGIAAGLADHALGQGAGSFHVSRIVEENKRLQRRVG